MVITKTHDKFVEQANKKHNNKYSYIDTYVGDKIKLSIACPIHGIFRQIPSSHLQGAGCPSCSAHNKSKLFRKTHDTFIIQANKIHAYKYSYPEHYINAKTKLKISCSVHGLFEQMPDKHLRGHGCPQCSGRVRKNKTQFVNEAIAIHGGKYTYPGEYINARTDIEISCPKHGVFLQIPDVHLNGSGCPTCSSNSSKAEMKWLDSLGIPNDNLHRHCKILIGKSYIKPDGFDPKTNTIYEFYGDYFHGNPHTTIANQINHKNGRSFKDLYDETIKREIAIKRAGYNLVSIWENDWNNQTQ